MKKAFLIPIIAAACAEPAPPPPPEPDLPYVRAYRAEGDQCFLVGESADTVEYLDHTADLVACPSDYEGLGVFVTETGAEQVTVLGSFTLFSVSTE